MKQTLLLLFVGLIFISCNTQPKVKSIKQSDIVLSDDYILTKEELINQVKSENQTLLVFWTKWCGGSQYMVKNIYTPMHAALKKENIDLNILIIAGDSNLEIENIDSLRTKGISAYYIPKLYSYPMFSRLAIRKYINSAFPKNNISDIKFGSLRMPVVFFSDSTLKTNQDTILENRLLNILQKHKQ